MYLCVCVCVVECICVCGLMCLCVCGWMCLCVWLDVFECVVVFLGYLSYVVLQLLYAYLFK